MEAERGTGSKPLASLRLHVKNSCLLAMPPTAILWL